MSMAKQTDAGKWTAVYLRVSSANQRDDSQAHEVGRYIDGQGQQTAIRYYKDKATGANLQRPEFERLEKDIFDGRVSTVVCWRLDRLARNLRDGVNVLANWCKAGVRVVSLCEQLDLSGAVGQLVAAVLFGVAGMEREAINERIRAGIAARKAKGLPMGRQRGDVGHRWNLAKRRVDPALAQSLRAQGVSVADIAARFKVSRPTVYAVLHSQ